METLKNMKKGTKVGLIVSLVLCAAVLINGAISIGNLFSVGNTLFAIYALSDIVMAALILLYLFFGYKKPHGNMLRYLFFVFSIYNAFLGIAGMAGEAEFITGCLSVFAALIIAYVAGRLDKINKNRFVLIFVGLLLLALFVVDGFITGIPISTFPEVFGQLTQLIAFTALSFAYTARYEQHKEAGLEDKP